MSYLMSIETDDGIEIGYRDENSHVPILVQVVVFADWQILEHWARFLMFIVEHRNKKEIPGIFLKAFEEVSNEGKSTG